MACIHWFHTALLDLHSMPREAVHIQVYHLKIRQQIKVVTLPLVLKSTSILRQHQLLQ